jgi:hypothetical protein
VIVLPERVLRGWWRREGHGLVLEDLDEVLDELPERLLVGTGAYGQWQLREGCQNSDLTLERGFGRDRRPVGCAKTPVLPPSRLDSGM